MQQSHEEGRGGGAGAGGAGAEFDETPERSLTTEAVSEGRVGQDPQPQALGVRAAPPADEAPEGGAEAPRREKR